MIKFEWNETKATSNYRKHGITFEEARSVFFDEFALQFFDEKHSDDEDRYIMLGRSIESRVLVVCHCEGDLGHVIRIISARKATKEERSYYPGP